MLIGREREVRTLVQNLRQGTHSIVFGLPGAGKTAILLEALSKSHLNQNQVVYVGNCSSRRSLLESALWDLRKRKATNGIGIKDLRDELLRICRNQSLCLVLDHVPVKLHPRMQRLFEMLEEQCTMVFGVTAGRDSYDLYYWKFNTIEVVNLPRASALNWIDTELRNCGYEYPLRRAIAKEIIRLTAGNPGSISRTLAILRSQTSMLDDAIRIRRIFVDGQISMHSRP